MMLKMVLTEGNARREEMRAVGHNAHEGIGRELVDGDTTHDDVTQTEVVCEIMDQHPEGVVDERAEQIDQKYNLPPARLRSDQDSDAELDQGEAGGQDHAGHLRAHQLGEFRMQLEHLLAARLVTLRVGHAGGHGRSMRQTTVGSRADVGTFLSGGLFVGRRQHQLTFQAGDLKATGLQTLLLQCNFGVGLTQRGRIGATVADLEEAIRLREVMFVVRLFQLTVVGSQELGDRGRNILQRLEEALEVLGSERVQRDVGEIVAHVTGQETGKDRVGRKDMTTSQSVEQGPADQSQRDRHRVRHQKMTIVTRCSMMNAMEHEVNQHNELAITDLHVEDDLVHKNLDQRPQEEVCDSSQENRREKVLVINQEKNGKDPGRDHPDIGLGEVRVPRFREEVNAAVAGILAIDPATVVIRVHFHDLIQRKHIAFGGDFAAVFVAHHTIAGSDTGWLRGRDQLLGSGEQRLVRSRWHFCVKQLGVQ
mmetsp:Transcript_18601/g.47272  ORF Transcript_18601/g.47272 Transcript_18601/m.47272 type:complete len:479 (-) Transcript_18601:142-1578(-)